MLSHTRLLFSKGMWQRCPNRQPWADPRSRVWGEKQSPIPFYPFPGQIYLCPQAPGELRSPSLRLCMRRSDTALHGRSRQRLITQVSAGPLRAHLHGPFPFPWPQLPLPTPVFQLHHLHIPRLALHGMLLLTATRSLLLLDIAIVPRGDPEEGYDDAKEVSEPGNDPDSGQGHSEVPRTQKEEEEPMDAVRGKKEMNCSSASYHIPFPVLGELLQYHEPSLL